MGTTETGPDGSVTPLSPRKEFSVSTKLYRWLYRLLGPDGLRVSATIVFTHAE